MPKREGIDDTKLVKHYCQCGREVMAPKNVKGVRCEMCTQALTGINVRLVKDPFLNKWLWERHPDGALVMPKQPTPTGKSKSKPKIDKTQANKRALQILNEVVQDFEGEDEVVEEQIVEGGEGQDNPAAPAEPAAKKPKRKRGKPITEEEVLEILAAPMKVGQIIAAFAERGRKVYQGPLNTKLKKMVEEGKIVRKQEAKQGKGRRSYVYHK